MLPSLSLLRAAACETDGCGEKGSGTNRRAYRHRTVLSRAMTRGDQCERGIDTRMGHGAGEIAGKDGAIS